MEKSIANNKRLLEISQQLTWKRLSSSETAQGMNNSREPRPSICRDNTYTQSDTQPYSFVQNERIMLPCNNTPVHIVENQSNISPNPLSTGKSKPSFIENRLNIFQDNCQYYQELYSQGRYIEIFKFWK